MNKKRLLPISFLSLLICSTELVWVDLASAFSQASSSSLNTQLTLVQASSSSLNTQLTLVQASESEFFEPLTFKAYLLTNIATVYISVGQNEKGSQILSESLDLVHSIRDQSAQSSALKDIATALVEAGKLEQAIQVAQSIPDESDKSEVLRSLITALVEAGKLDQALQVAQFIAQSIPNFPNEPEIEQSVALGYVVSALVEAEKLDQALQLAQSIPNEHIKSMIMVFLAQELVAAKQPAQAIALVDQALEMSRGL